MTYSTFKLSSKDRRTPLLGVNCGHKHRTVRTAQQCSEKLDPFGFQRWGVFRSDGLALTKDEIGEKFWDKYDNAKFVL